MSGAPVGVPVLDEDVSAVIGGLGWERSEVCAVEREPCAYASSYDAEILGLRRRDGELRRAFVKDFRASSLAKHDIGERRERELHVYRDLLGGSGLGTPALYGALWAPEREVFRLLLEHVDGLPLRYCDVDAWVDAAGWLGRLHGRARSWGERLRVSGLLVRHDRDFFLGRAAAAEREVRRRSPLLAGRLRATTQGYEEVAERLAGEPATLVHGAFLPQNIVVGSQEGGRRICPVDWELAAVGSPAYDLAFLVDGFQGDELRRLVERYRTEAEAHGVIVPDEAELLAVFEPLRLHRVLTWLSHCADRSYAPADIESLVAAAEGLTTRIGGGA